VTREEDCARLMGMAVQHYGRLDALVCCAGILRGSYAPVEELDEATFRTVIDVNLVGTYLCVRRAVPYLKRTGNGVVLLIASGAGVRGPSSSFAYGASKGGVHGLAMTLEPRLAALGIRVHDICPAVIDTEMMRGAVAAGARAAGRSEEEALAGTSFGDPRGVARVLAFLASPDADYVRGTVFTR
jgi:NAD(P)-dependent dehydrogenase (short-subunit alcohol dehydrogenase family)